MAVRFLPPPSEPVPGGGQDRANLAEVVELRGLLRQRTWGTPADSDTPADSESRAGADPRGDVGAPAGEPASGPEEGAAAVAPAAVAATGEPASPAASAIVTALSDRLVRASELPAPAEVGERPAVAPGARRAAVTPVSLTDAQSEARGVPADPEDPESDPARAAYDDGVRLLARRARSSGELREELLRLDHAAAHVDVLIDEFCESHYLDDLGLARTVTEKLRTAKRASRSQIRMKLRERRLADAIIDEALGELDDDEEFTLLRDAAVARASKLGGLDRQVAERRLLGFLARRGWSGEPAMRAVKAALDGGGSGRSGGGVRFR
ncbi:regulatory protein RecX [Leucobacter luti]|uniref:Regulatory protein RecX n=1 Tax=Leucobacter luti TaxID=340320 RepID=A0A4Q7TTZ7_9MICO|nr:regulatory protein RecX [Leucobacter luti]MBL3698470.1 hypothetical protein [Leucobacter luti]RZT64441.1 SOS response regulatory protein OraA/RecX [Leucobacter luti]